MITSDLSEHTIMITGVSGQIGQSLVSAATGRGARVLGLDLSLTAAKEQAKNLNWDMDRICLIEADVRSDTEVRDAFNIGVERFGQITSQINNAGVSVFEPWSVRTEEEFDLVTNVNLKGSFNCMRSFIQYCINTGTQGAIVNIASHYGLISPDPRIYTDCDRRSPEVYGATKAGIIQMTKYFAVNAIVDGASVRVNAVAPGGVRNPWEPQGEDFQRLYSERCPMGRLAEIEEIAGPTLFLLAKESSYINGHTLVVDGGMTAW